LPANGEIPKLRIPLSSSISCLLLSSFNAYGLQNERKHQLLGRMCISKSTTTSKYLSLLLQRMTVVVVVGVLVDGVTLIKWRIALHNFWLVLDAANWLKSGESQSSVEAPHLHTHTY